MKRIIVAAWMAALVAVPAHAAQDGSQVEAADTALRLPVVEGARVSPDCGGLLSGQVQCMAAPLADISRIGELYMQALPQAGWAHVGGGDNAVLFQSPREGGGCDFLEMVAFYDPSLDEDALAVAPGYLGFTLKTDGDCLTAPIDIPSAQ